LKSKPTIRLRLDIIVKLVKLEEQT